MYSGKLRGSLYRILLFGFVHRFQALIEREWLQAGHPFQTRHSHGCFSSSNSGRTKSQGATFLLFLDCVWQIQNQFIGSFEFSTNFLILLFEHSCSSEYGKNETAFFYFEIITNSSQIYLRFILGTFLGNCEADREMFDLSQKTVSLWSYINRTDILKKLFNPLYTPSNRIIWPSVAPMSLVNQFFKSIVLVLCI